MDIKTSTKLINIVYIVLQISLIIAFIARRDYSNVIATVLVFLIYISFLFFEHEKGVKITDFIRIAVLATVFANSFVGEYLKLYITSGYFDKFLHVFGVFSFSVFTFLFIKDKDYWRYIPKTHAFLFIILFGTFIGTVFEIGEFFCDVIFKTTNQPNLTDTDIDMICDIVGAVFAGIFIIHFSLGVFLDGEN